MKSLFQLSESFIQRGMVRVNVLPDEFPTFTHLHSWGVTKCQVKNTNVPPVSTTAENSQFPQYQSDRVESGKPVRVGPFYYRSDLN